MKESKFTLLRQTDWQAWDDWLQKKKKQRRLLPPFPSSELPHRFRMLCADLSLARDRNYSAPLIDSLHDRVLRAQQRIYGAQARLRHGWLRFLASGFPVQVRTHWRFVVPALLLFFVPLLAFIVCAQIWPESVYLILAPDKAASYEQMYSPSATRLGAREAGDDFTMLGYYIWNNVRIDFQCFASGLLFGIGSIFFLLYNGLMIGAVAGHLTQAGLIETFWGFVAGHSSFELLGASFSGAAGLMIGYALVAPGGHTRVQALRNAAKNAVGLLYGAAFMTFCAAFIEAFWSPLRSFPVTVKYSVGLGLWVLLIAYFLLAGRKRGTDAN